MHELTIRKGPDYPINFFVGNGLLRIVNQEFADQPWVVPLDHAFLPGESRIILGADLARGFNTLTLKISAVEKGLLKIELVGLIQDEETIWVFSLSEFNTHLNDRGKPESVLDYFSLAEVLPGERWIDEWIE